MAYSFINSQFYLSYWHLSLLLLSSNRLTDTCGTATSSTILSVRDRNEAIQNFCAGDTEAWLIVRTGYEMKKLRMCTSRSHISLCYTADSDSTDAVAAFACQAQT